MKRSKISKKLAVVVATCMIIPQATVMVTQAATAEGEVYYLNFKPERLMFLR